MYHKPPTLPFWYGDAYGSGSAATTRPGQSTLDRFINHFNYKVVEGNPGQQSFLQPMPACPVFCPKELGTCLALYYTYDSHTIWANQAPSLTYVVQRIFPLPVDPMTETQLRTFQRQHLFYVPAAHVKPMKWAVYQLPSAMPNLDDEIVVISDVDGRFQMPFKLLATVRDDPRYVIARNAVARDYPEVVPALLAPPRKTPVDVVRRLAVYQLGTAEYDAQVAKLTEISGSSTSLVPDTATAANPIVYY
jgi:hypothetical protein